MGKNNNIDIQQMAHLKWNNKIEIIGIVYSHCDQIIETNFERIVDKAKANISCWYGRKLTLYG